MPTCPLNICALIPTYNNGGTIADVVRRTWKVLPKIIVVVDGSTDQTMEELQGLGLDLTIIQRPKNGGKGAALKDGLKKAIEMGYDYCLTLDGDGQHYPEDIPLLLDKLMLHGDNSLIIGSRVLVQDNMPRKNTFANRFSNFWYKLQTGLNMPDTQSGMRIYPLHHMGHYRWITHRYESELELLVFAAWRNVNIYSVPIRVYYPPKEERVSHFRPAYDFSRIFVLNTILCILALVYGWPRRGWRTVYCVIAIGVMILYVQVRTLWHFMVHGHGEESVKAYHKIIQKGSKWVITHVADDHYTLVNNHGEDIEPKEPVMYIANHGSLYDIMAVLSLQPNIIALTNHWVSKNPLYALVAKMAQYEVTDNDLDEVLPRLREKVAQGYSIIIFPEGTRSKTGDVIRFHRGAFYIAEQLGIPIQPLLLRGMFDALNKVHFHIRITDISMELLPKLMPDDMTMGSNYQERTRMFQHYYKHLLRKEKTALVMGGGVGGLFTAALLAEKGWIPTVVEQLPVAGGGLYSYEKNNRWWQTGIHVASGLEEGGTVSELLKRWGIKVPLEKIGPNIVHGQAPKWPGEEMSLLYGGETVGTKESRAKLMGTFEKGMYRFEGGTRSLTDQLVGYISEHGGRVMLGEKVTKVRVEHHMVTGVEMESGRNVTADRYISSLHPKQLIRLTDGLCFHPAARKRIQETPETYGSMKVYLALKPGMVRYMHENHFILPDNILFYTQPVVGQGEYAETMEIIAPLDYQELAPWHEARNDEYVAWKEKKAEELLNRIEEYMPIRDAIESMFTSTSLTYRDDYLTVEGAMFGLSQSVGAVHTAVKNLYLTGQNCYIHGLCGTVSSSVMLAECF